MLSSIGSSIGSSIDLSSIGFDVVAGAATAEDPRLEIAQWGQSDVGVALADCAADAYLTAGRPACSVRQQEGAGRLPGAGVAFLVQIHHLICNGGRSLTSLARWRRRCIKQTISSINFNSIFLEHYTANVCVSRCPLGDIAWGARQLIGLNLTMTSRNGRASSPTSSNMQISCNKELGLARWVQRLQR